MAAKSKLRETKVNTLYGYDQGGTTWKRIKNWVQIMCLMLALHKDNKLCMAIINKCDIYLLQNRELLLKDKYKTA